MKTFKSYITEAKVITIEPARHGDVVVGKPIKVYKNPSTTDLKAIHRNSVKENKPLETHIRGYTDSDGHMYAWNGYDATHYHIQKTLGHTNTEDHEAFMMPQGHAHAISDYGETKKWTKLVKKTFPGGRIRNLLKLYESVPARIPYESGTNVWDNYRGKVEDVPIHWLKKLPGNELRHPEDIDSMAKDIKTNGIKEPLIINVGKTSRTAKLGEGNHRLAAAERAGFTHVPARVVVGHSWGAENKHSQPKGIDHDLIPKHDEYFPADARPSEVFRSLQQHKGDNE